MRLLHFDEPGKLAWTDFTGKQLPPYAILSHRWGEGEVLYEDLLSGKYTEKTTGFEKILFCAQRAAQDRLQYFWSDTCCINKWDHQERSIAINSMFAWYKGSAKCYAFLTDVSVPFEADVQQQHVWEASFRKSPWFTRGWTLQELIAPGSVEFFTREHWRLGDKANLTQLLHEITSLPIPVLQGCDLQQFSHSDRLGWAANRVTTEPEDKAYCLLGILGVEMPFIYQQGLVKERELRAMKQLHEALTISAPSIIPFFQNDHFVGRETELAALEAKLCDNTKTTKVAILGTGGTGKSQLALQFAYRTKAKSSHRAIFWIDASNKSSLREAYRGIAKKLNIPGHTSLVADFKQLVKTHLSKEDAPPWLLLFDGMESLSYTSSSSLLSWISDLEDHMPESPQGHIVIVTSNASIAERLAVEDVIELHELSQAAGLHLLSYYLTDSQWETDETEMKLLLQNLSNLPLAITQAAAYIRTTNISLRDYRAQFLASQGEARRLHETWKGGDDEFCISMSPVTITLLQSLEYLVREDPPVASLLCLAGCIDSNDIPLSLFARVWTNVENNVQTLQSLALVTRRPAEFSMDIHRLVHVALRAWLQKEDRGGKLALSSTVLMLAMLYECNDEHRGKWRRLLPHARHVLFQTLGEQRRFAKPGVDLPLKPGSSGGPVEVRKVQGDLSKDDENLLKLILKYTGLLNSDGRYQEVEELFAQVQGLEVLAFDAQHPIALSCMNNKASANWSKGRTGEAIVLEVRITETKQRLLGDEHEDTLLSMNNLAASYTSQGLWKEGEELHKRTLEMRRRLLDKEHPDVLISMAGLAVVYSEQGRWNEAEELETQILGVRQRKLGVEHPDTLLSMHNLAWTYHNQRRWNEAEKLRTYVLEARQRILGVEHPETLQSMANLATTYAAQGRWKESEELETRALEARRRISGVEHSGTLATMGNLALTYRCQGRSKDAEELEVQVLAVRQKVLGATHPETLTGMANLSYTRKSLGKDAEALELMIQCKTLSEATLGETHPHTIKRVVAVKEWSRE